MHQELVKQWIATRLLVCLASYLLLLENIIMLLSENIITSDGLLTAPGTSNAFENEDKMEVSYDIANEDDLLLGKSDDEEQIPPYQVPRKPKQPKQQRQSRDRRPQRSTSEPRTEQYRKRRRQYSPSTEKRKRSLSLSAEDKISQAEGAIKALKGTRTREPAQKPYNIGRGRK